MLMAKRLPSLGQKFAGSIESSSDRFFAEEILEDSVDERAANGDRIGWLWEAVDRAEAEQQRTRQEIARAAGGECNAHLCGGAILHGMDDRRPLRHRYRGGVTNGAMRMGRIGGTDVVMSPSMLIMGIALVALFAPMFQVRGALLLVVGLYASVFLHELAHFGAARAFGLRVSAITLHLLGGETSIRSAHRSPQQEFVIAVVGPLVSLAIGLGLRSSGGVLGALGWINLVLAVFNLLPGLPLDGGRAASAAIWKISGNEALGILVAGWLGRLIAVGVVALGIVRADVGHPGWSFDLALSVFVAWVLWEGAGHAIAQVRRTP